MSLNGTSYVMINTSRDEGYDIQFRFKTTLPNGLLAIGKGPTFYILQLQHGRLNLQSSILNKLEGVFIGSGLNNSSWQKVWALKMLTIRNKSLIDLDIYKDSYVRDLCKHCDSVKPILIATHTWYWQPERSGPIHINTSYTSFPTTYLGN